MRFVGSLASASPSPTQALHKTLRWLSPFAAIWLLFTPACSKKKSDEDTKSKKGDSDEPKKKKKDDGKKDDGKKDDGKKDDDKKDDDKKPVVGCKLPEDNTISADLTLPKGCKLKISAVLNVEGGASLTILEGSTLSFDAGQYINVAYGKLVAKGTEEAPVTFTSSNKSPAPGDWQGLVFGDKASAGTDLDHVVVEYAGKGAFNQGAVVLLYEQSGRFALRNSIVRKNANAGIWGVHEPTSFDKFENNKFSENADTAMRIGANALGSIGKGNRFGEPIRFSGIVSKSATWPEFDVPLVAAEEVRIEGEKEAAVVKLADKTVIKFNASVAMRIGEGNGGGLVAKKATFTSANATAGEGDWAGLVFFDKTVNTELDDCTFEFGGAASAWGNGVIRLQKAAKEYGAGLKLTNLHLRKNKTAAMVAPENDCGPYADAKSGNKSDGLPLCAKE